jgi:predicted cupin superfamily sugar epimerase
MDAASIRHLLDLAPLTFEGGFFRETYRSPHSTAIYFLLTEDTCSRFHRLRGDEVYHFYLGDPVELYVLQDGDGELRTLGTNQTLGERPQTVVPAGAWQGSRLVPGGKVALLGTTMAPGFDLAGFEAAERDALIKDYARWHQVIEQLTPARS